MQHAVAVQAIIDFGLSHTSNIHEDKAVDLYVLERAVSSMAATNDSNDVVSWPILFLSFSLTTKH